MPKDGMMIAGLVLVCVALAAADQLRQGLARPPAHPATLAVASPPVAGLAPAIALGAQHRLDRGAARIE